MKPITPMLWLDGRAEEAMNFYVSLFPDSKVLGVMRAPRGTPDTPEGQVLTASFRINGQEFTALNGGPQFKFNEAVSFVIHCDTQEEVDRYWNALTKDGGEESMCGWLKDRFGVSWQVTPDGIDEIFSDADPEKATRAMRAMFKMRKLDVEALRQAAEGVPAG
jgi:predicted 3-demethylubiquinone-9 3-methyltransferase (glyoxalase superfamily)